MFPNPKGLRETSRTPTLQTVVDLSRSELQNTSFCSKRQKVPIPPYASQAEPGTSAKGSWQGPRCTATTTVAQMHEHSGRTDVDEDVRLRQRRGCTIVTPAAVASGRQGPPGLTSVRKNRVKRGSKRLAERTRTRQEPVSGGQWAASCMEQLFYTAARRYTTTSGGADAQSW
jgi:hypothetical protein